MLTVSQGGIWPRRGEPRGHGFPCTAKRPDSLLTGPRGGRNRGLGDGGCCTRSVTGRLRAPAGAALLCLKEDHGQVQGHASYGRSYRPCLTFKPSSGRATAYWTRARMPWGSVPEHSSPVTRTRAQVGIVACDYLAGPGSCGSTVLIPAAAVCPGGCRAMLNPSLPSSMAGGSP